MVPWRWKRCILFISLLYRKIVCPRNCRKFEKDKVWSSLAISVLGKSPGFLWSPILPGRRLTSSCLWLFLHPHLPHHPKEKANTEAVCTPPLMSRRQPFQRALQPVQRWGSIRHCLKCGTAAALEYELHRRAQQLKEKRRADLGVWAPGELRRQRSKDLR